MCYSILMETDLKRLAAEFDAIIDYPAFLNIYESRSRKVANLQIPRALDANFIKPENEACERIAQLAAAFESDKIRQFEQKAFAKRQLIAELEEKLAKRWSKTNQAKLDTAKRVLDKALYDIKRLQAGYIWTDRQIFQYSYAPLILRVGDQKIIRPVRYQIRPRGSHQEYNRKLNLFNARTDKLEERTNWKRLFMSQHAVVVFQGFFEWVEGPDGKSKEINFFPQGEGFMWAPAIYDHWQDPKGQNDIYSFAILTRDPPEEVAAMGHDRCPVFPQWDFMSTWLDPLHHTKEEMYRGFETLHPVKYDYKWVA